MRMLIGSCADADRRVAGHDVYTESEASSAASVHASVSLMRTDAEGRTAALRGITG